MLGNDRHPSLKKAILDLHGCDSTWVESVPVTETFQRQTVGDGTVEVFDLIDHPTATRCYAWSHAVDGSEKRRYVAVLHQGPVDSPEAAVRAAIASEVKQKWNQREARRKAKDFRKEHFGEPMRCSYCGNAGIVGADLDGCASILVYSDSTAGGWSVSARCSNPTDCEARHEFTPSN